ncbi:tryptophan synthase subunit alpha [Akkermansia muciniphila]|nr:tryptophan synthase subunit alpha [Akkermansia muciniphila]
MERAHALGRRAVIPFITAGFPDKDSFWTHLSRIDESGADIIEIGVPFSDPVADGPVIEQASRDALARGVSLKWILDGLKARKGCFSAKLVLMGYVNPFYQYGLEQLARDAEEAGVSGFIVPDMPLEESGMFREVFSPRGLTLVTLVAPNTSVERMREYKPYTSGFVYVVSVLGTTGGKANLEQSVTETMRRARSVLMCRWRWASVFRRRTSWRRCRKMPVRMPPCLGALCSGILEKGRTPGNFWENGPEVEPRVSPWLLRIGLRNLLCRPILFYLVIDYENTDSQSASLLFTYYSIF